MGWYVIAALRAHRRATVSQALIVAMGSLVLAFLTGFAQNLIVDNARQAVERGQDPSATGPIAMVYGIVVLLGCAALLSIVRSTFAAAQGARVRQMGLLACVGATPRQILGCLMGECLAVGVPAAVIGVLLGVGATKAVVDTAAALAPQILGEDAHRAAFAMDPFLLGVVLIAVLVPIVASAWLVARSLARVSPLAAARGAAETTVARASGPGILGRLLGYEGALAKASLAARRRDRRSSTVAIALSFVTFGTFLSFMAVSMAVNQTNLAEAGRVEELARNEAIWQGYLAIVGGFCGVLALIGVVGVIAQAVGILERRRREFARLRALGLTPSGLRRMLATEALGSVFSPMAAMVPVLAAVAVAFVAIGRVAPAEYLAWFPWSALCLYLAAIAAIVGAAYAIVGHHLMADDLTRVLNDDALL